MIFCKNCGEQVIVGNKLDIDIGMWNHLKTRHPDIFKRDENEDLEEIWSKNFRADNSESDYLAIREGSCSC